MNLLGRIGQTVKRWFPSTLMAWRNLGRNRVRTGLAALGIIIGVVAIATLGITGTALQYQATADLGSLTNEIFVSTGEDNLNDGLTDPQVEEIERVARDAEVVPQKSNDTLLSENGETARVSVTGVADASSLYTPEQGDAPERFTTGALLTSGAAEELGLELGDPVEYNGQLYRIRGILEPDSGFGPGGGQEELVLPMSALSDQDYYGTVTVIVADGESAQVLASAIETELNEPDEEVVDTFTPKSVQEDVNSFLNTLELALLGIGSISLIVANVAILNVMLMSIIERRGEIGVLRAVGVRRGEVLRMILAEAAFLGIVGGLIGVLISFAIGFGITRLLVDDPTIIFRWNSLRYLLYGFIFAVGASVLSGLYPAWKAANERPVDALRS